ncbi:MAG TPA: TetR/AcrR family transcriptional regulator [Solirubrobacteraceae bacterium]|nr:TetR/AcrR family transcriptional regulator [Solirubrobacteraceae bacterium]
MQRRRTRTRAALLDVAERAFMLDGFHAVSIEMLADEADVSVGSIYNLFSSKLGLYLAVAERATDLFAEVLQRAYAASDSPLEQVMACGDAYLRFHLEHPGAFRLIAFEGVDRRMSPADEELQRAVTAKTIEALDGFRDHIAAAVAAGEAGQHVDPDLTARVLFASWNGMIGLGLRHDDLALDDDQIAAMIEQARRIVLNGLTDPAYRDSSGMSQARLLSVPAEADDPAPA